MKKVLMLLSNPFNPDPRVYKEARSLVKAGYEVTILCWDRQLKQKKNENIEGIHIERIRLKAGYGFKSMIFKLPVFWVKIFLKSIKKDFDIIHSHDFDTAIVGYFLKIFKKKKWVYDSHDLYFTFFMMEGNKESTIAKIIKKIDVFLARRCNLLLVPTESLGGKYEGLREFYEKRGVKKIITLWNAPLIQEFLKYKKAKLKKSKEYTIGFLGGIRTTKNFIPLFRAVESLGKKYQILFVGGGKSEEILKRKSKEYKVKVKFIGPVKYQVISNYYRSCDVIYSFYPPRPNVLRGMSTKLFEAAILGIPTITNEESLMSDFVKEYKCGVTIKKATIKELREAILKSKEIKFNSNIIRKRWCWENEEKKLIGGYNQL